jgi:hypothetical protein
LARPSQYSARAKAWLTTLGDAPQPPRAVIVPEVMQPSPNSARSSETVRRYLRSHIDQLELCWARFGVDGLRSIQMSLDIRGTGTVYARIYGDERTALLRGCLDKVVRQFRFEPLELPLRNLHNVADEFPVYLSFVP